MPPRTRQRCAAIAQLASRIEADIRRRGLKPGDAYQGTAETTRMLKAGAVTVNQALQLLVKRNVLVRRQRSGTFIGGSFGASRREVALERVRILMYDHHLVEEGIFESGMLLGMQGELPGTHIQVDSMPRNVADEAAWLAQFIEQSLGSRQREGFVLFNSTVGMQRAFHQSGLPTVVAGGLYASIEGLPYIDRDQKQVGSLLAEYLLGRGHRRIVMITRQRPGMGPGEYQVADAVSEVAARLGLSANSLVARSLPHDTAVVRCEVKRLLEGCDERPGIIVRPWQMIEAVYGGIESAGLRPQRDVAVAVADYFQPGALPYPVIRSALSMREQGARMAQLLLGQADSAAVLIPVRLEVPVNPKP